jgi:hypothetical protein
VIRPSPPILSLTLHGLAVAETGLLLSYLPHLSRRVPRSRNAISRTDVHVFCSFPTELNSQSGAIIDQQTFDHLLPLAYEWAKAQEEYILTHGVPLGPRHMADAGRVGVQDCSQVKVLVVRHIPLPGDARLAEAAKQTYIITEASRGVAIGHGIIIRADCWGDRELMLHQLVHVAQCERSGGLESFVELYLRDRQTCAKFTIGSFEEEARRVAHEIWTADMAMK